MMCLYQSPYLLKTSLTWKLTEGSGTGVQTVCGVRAWPRHGARMFYWGRERAVHAWVDNSVKMIASGDLFPDAIQSKIGLVVQSSVSGCWPPATLSPQPRAAASARGAGDRSALRRPVYGPYIGRASTARLITLSRMIYSVAGPDGSGRTRGRHRRRWCTAARRRGRNPSSFIAHGPGFVADARAVDGRVDAPTMNGPRVSDL